MGEDSGEAQSLSERPRRPPARRYAAPETRYRRVRIALQQYHGIAGHLAPSRVTSSRKWMPFFYSFPNFLPGPARNQHAVFRSLFRDVGCERVGVLSGDAISFKSSQCIEVVW